MTVTFYIQISFTAYALKSTIYLQLLVLADNTSVLSIYKLICLTINILQR